MEYFFWQNENWPHFTWDINKLVIPLGEVQKNQGILEGQMNAMGFNVQSQTAIDRFTSEIKKSYEIEGADISDYSVRSSVARKLGLENIIINNGQSLDKPRKSVDAVVDVIFDAVQNCNSPLTTERLYNWNRQLFGGIYNSQNEGFNGLYKINIGQFRTDEYGPMTVISGSPKNEVVHYIAPPAANIPNEIDKFLSWFNEPAESQNLNNILKSAIAHLYFVSIHPFEDGNGRLARAIADMALCRQKSAYTERKPYPLDHLYSMSAQLCLERKDYYCKLEEAQRGSMDITEWLLWYIGCMNRAVLSVIKELNNVEQRKAFWERIENFDINERQHKILSLLIDDFEGKLTSTKYGKICKCSHDTASRDIEKLIKLGILEKGEKGGRSTCYCLAKDFRNN